MTLAMWCDAGGRGSSSAFKVRRPMQSRSATGGDGGVCATVCRLNATVVLYVCVAAFAAASQSFAGEIAAKAAGRPAPVLRVGPGAVVVQPKFGGHLLGFGIDPSGGEGLLSEYVELPDGNSLIATETFRQTTGKIVKVVAKENDSQNGYGTWGVYGQHVGLDEFYQQGTNTFPVLAPLKGNAVTGAWTPPIQQGYYLHNIAGNLRNSDVAVLTFENGGNYLPSVFASNLKANTFGPQVAITDGAFCSCDSPVIALDTRTHQAVLGTATGTTTPPRLAIADLRTGSVTVFTGIGDNFVNGIAVDPATDIAVTTTEGSAIQPAGVQFYDLKNQTGFQVILPCSAGGGQDYAGMTVAFDPVDSLFLVAQLNTTCSAASAIDVYDENGNLLEMLIGFQQFSPTPTPINLHPGDRTGFVYEDRFLLALQSFNY